MVSVDPSKIGDGLSVVGSGTGNVLGWFMGVLKSILAWFSRLSWFEWLILIVLVILIIVYRVVRANVGKRPTTKRVSYYKF